MHSIGNIDILTKREAFKYIDVLYVRTCLKKNRTRMLKLLSVLGKNYLDDINVFAFNIIGKCENWPDNLQSMCLADFASSYANKKVGKLPKEPVSSLPQTMGGGTFWFSKNKLSGVRVFHFKGEGEPIWEDLPK